MTVRRNRRKYESEVATVSAADMFKLRLGFKEPTEPFHTSANRGCGDRGVIKPGKIVEDGGAARMECRQLHTHVMSLFHLPI